ncbi:hypothetical protein [Sorangium sp. So ce887]|uniref:hypothetical protein n=1 Tax=Sorangium sp. So ce887 TaxID=3133324 RepID=UPI003F631BE9
MLKGMALLGWRRPPAQQGHSLRPATMIGASWVVRLLASQPLAFIALACELPSSVGMKTPGVVAMGCWLLAGCSGPDFDGNRARWRADRPEEYVISICGTGFARGCTLVAVSGDTVVATAHSPSDAPSGSDWTFAEAPEQADPVEALFDRAAGESEDCELTRIRFDDRYGYVADHYKDCGEEGSGEQVTCFQADTNDVTRCTE